MDPQIIQILRRLVQLGIPISALANIPGLQEALGGVGGAFGLVGNIQSGNVPGTIGSAAQVGSAAAGLAGMPGVSSALGSVGGPLGIISGLATGNYGGAAASVLPTISSLASLGGATGVIAPATAASVGAAVSTAALPVTAALMMALYDTKGEDMFDQLFGNDTHAKAQYLEKKNAPDDFNAALQKMAAGAGTLGQSGDLMSLLQTAQDGINTRSNFGHNFDILKNDYGADVSEIEAVSPALSGANWKSWTQLMDRGAREGIDTSGITGHGPEWIDVGHSGRSSQEYFTDPVTGTNTKNAPAGTPGYTTSEANDLSQAIYGYAQSQGNKMDGPLPGARGDGGYLAPDQLAELGLTPGNYEQGIIDYLTNMGSMGPAVAPTPGVTSWQPGNESHGGM